jgi:hypothetical protein
MKYININAQKNKKCHRFENFISLFLESVVSKCKTDITFLFLYIINLRFYQTYSASYEKDQHK